MKRKIHCGVIGAGWWGTFAHIPALLEHPDAELVAIQHHDPDTAARIARDFGVPIACTTAQELLDIDEIEAVVISSTPNLHYEQALAALSSGRHVLIEKPMTFTAEQARKLVSTAREKNVRFLLSCPWHYTSHAREARTLIRNGELGSIRMISILMTNPVSDLLRGVNVEPTHGGSYFIRPGEATYSDPEVAGGGQIYAQVPHIAAYLTFLTGAWPSEVFARFHNDGAVLDIYDTLNLRMEDGMLVSIASTGATSLDRRDYEVRIFGTRGILFMDLWRGTMSLAPLAGGERRFPQLAADEVYPHQAPARNLIDSISDPALNQAPAILGLAAMEIVEAACQSARTGLNVPIPAEKDFPGRAV